MPTGAMERATAIVSATLAAIEATRSGEGGLHLTGELLAQIDDTVRSGHAPEVIRYLAAGYVTGLEIDAERHGLTPNELLTRTVQYHTKTNPT